MFRAFGCLFAVFISLSANFNVCAQVDDLEFKVFYYPNGEKSSEGYLTNSDPVGFWKAYYVDGTLKSEGLRKNGQLDSVWVFYYRNGLIHEKINYLNGKKNGFFYSYNFYKNQDSLIFSFLEQEVLYLNNVKHGICNDYWFNGNLKSSVKYINGLKDDLSKEFDIDGNIVGITIYSLGRIIDYQAINRFKDGFKHGLWKEFYSNGNLKCEMNYLNGSLNGIVRNYDIHGTFIGAMRYENNQIIDSLVLISASIDIKEEFYDRLDEFGDPIKKFSGGYVDNVPVGVHRTYDSLGRVNSSKLYNSNGNLIGKGIVNIEGDKVGFWEFYYDTGNIKSKGLYANNRRIGDWSYYYETGEVEQLGIFVDGRPSGKWQWFYPSGNLRREDIYLGGRENGLSVEYDDYGAIISKGIYDRGLRQGEWFFNFVSHKEYGQYVDDLQVGPWVYKYNNGSLYFEGKFLNGYEDGKHVYYHENEKIKEKRFYISGMKTKNWEYYDYYGSLIKVLTFENNKLIKIDGVAIVTD